jgi:hypothetical protein
MLVLDEKRFRANVNAVLHRSRRAPIQGPMLRVRSRGYGGGAGIRIWLNHAEDRVALSFRGLSTLSPHPAQLFSAKPCGARA